MLKTVFRIAKFLRKVGRSSQGVPTHNFQPKNTLKTWYDQIFPSSTILAQKTDFDDYYA